jgi:hypothetical protein
LKIALIVGIAAVIVGLGIWLTCRPKKFQEYWNPHSPKKRSKSERQTGQQDIPGSVAVEAEPNHSPSVTNEKESREQRKECRECVTLCIEVLGLLGLSAYAYISYQMWGEMGKQSGAAKEAADAADSAAKIAQGQLTEMQAEQRAWISLTKDSGITSINVDEVNQELYAETKFSLQNTGRNPAVSVFVNAEVAIPSGNLPLGSMHAWQNAVCNLPKGGPGFTMFPNSLEPTYQVRANTHQGELAQWRSTYGQNTPMAPIIAACIIYQDAITGLMHHTPFAFETLMGAPRASDGCAMVSLKCLPISPPNIVARIWIMDNKAPD